MMELTACPPSAGSESTSATLRPRRAASSAAETPAMPAPSTQMSADTLRALAPAGRRTIRVAVAIFDLSAIMMGGAGSPAHDSPHFSAGEPCILTAWIGRPAEHDRNLNVSAPLQDFHRHLGGVAANLEIDAR